MEFLEGDIIIYKRMRSVYLDLIYMSNKMHDKICEIVKILNDMYFIVPIPHRVKEGFDLENGYWSTINSISLHIELTRDSRIDRLIGK